MRRGRKPASAKKQSAFKEADDTSNLSQKLVSAAMSLLESKHSSDLTFRKIAAKAGVSHMAPYRIFKSKEDLYKRIAELGYWQLNKNLQEAIDRHPLDPRKQLHQGARNYYDFTNENPETVELMFGRKNRAKKVNEIDAALTAAIEATAATFIRLIQNSQLADVLPGNADTDELSFTFWSYVHGFSLLRQNLDEPPTPRKKPYDALGSGLDSLIQGIKTKKD